MQGVLDRVQVQLTEQRLMRALSQRRGQTIDIQIGFNVYLDVPQEMRSRLWLVILSEPSLALPFQVRDTLSSGPAVDAHGIRSGSHSLML